jgi:methylisocitrate lyase
VLPLSGVTHAPGVVDPVTALLAAGQGARALHLSGAVVSASRLGLPDLGFVHGDDITAVARAVTRVVDVPLVADADTGYGGALQVARTVETYASAGVAALHLEDQVSPKRCGHLAGKEVLPLDEAVAKVRAAVDVKALTIIARTDALSVHGLEEAVRRAHAYADAGADLVFVEGARTAEELAAVGLPQVLNRSQAGTVDALPDELLDELQVRLVIHPVGAYLAMLHAARAVYAGDEVPMLAWDELTDLLGQPALLEAERTYAP